MRGGAVQQQKPSVVAEEGERDKKKRTRRPNRRGRQSALPVSGVACNSTDGMCEQACGKDSSSSNVSSVAESYSSRNAAEPDKASDVAFRSLPTMRINAASEFGSGHSFSALEEASPDLNFRSCPEPVSSNRRTTPSSPWKEGDADMVHRKYFARWSIEAANKAIERGDAFKALFRVNAHNRLEAYCTVDGVPTDILISGVPAQNRAIEGDIVVVSLDPVTSWPRLKGSAGRSENALSGDDFSTGFDLTEAIDNNLKMKDKLDFDAAHLSCENGLLQGPGFPGGVLFNEVAAGLEGFSSGSNGQHSTITPLNGGSSFEQGGAAKAVDNICALLSSFPSRRPTGRILAILEESPRRDAVVGFLGAKQFLSYKEGYKKDISGQLLKKNGKLIPLSFDDYIQLTPSDPKFPKMMVPVTRLPNHIEERLKNGDETVGLEIMAARIEKWGEESFLPQAEILHVLGRSGEIEPQIAAIIFENSIYSAKFSSELFDSLPSIPWEVSAAELQERIDLRNICTFTIDPPAASELDDALSIQRVSDHGYQVGVHIADVSYFVQPDTNIDKEAQIRSTSVYLPQHKLPMLPPQFSEGIASLNPGVDRFALSVIWTIDQEGNVVDQWIGRTVIKSCCKLSYPLVQTIFDGSFNADCLGASQDECPSLHGRFDWYHVAESINTLYGISKKLKENRFRDGALWLNSSKLSFSFDESGMPCDIMLNGQTDSNHLVEEFMLLANKTVAEVISRAFPECALLRRHPEPNLGKLKEFEAFCNKHGFELDPSSAQLHLSLLKIREKLKSDPVMFEILISYASRPMKLAEYFNSGDLKGKENEWAHYALALPFYTHFTSALRRYPDIIVHRTLSAVLEAERMYLKKIADSNSGGFDSCVLKGCFTGLAFDKEAAESKEGKEALHDAALKCKIPQSAVLSNVAAYCNMKKLNSRHAEEAGQKLYLWTLLKKKEALISDARVLGLGPKFMSVYIEKLAMKRRIYYDEVEGLIVDWLETTSTLVLGLSPSKRFQKRGSPGKIRSVEHVAYIINPSSITHDKPTVTMGNCGRVNIGQPKSNCDSLDAGMDDPAVLPLTLRLLSTVRVVLNAAGGEGTPLDISARLYLSSYFSR